VCCSYKPFHSIPFTTAQEARPASTISRPTCRAIGRYIHTKRNLSALCARPGCHTQDNERPIHQQGGARWRWRWVGVLRASDRYKKEGPGQNFPGQNLQSVEITPLLQQMRVCHVSLQHSAAQVIEGPLVDRGENPCRRQGGREGGPHRHTFTQIGSYTRVRHIQHAYVMGSAQQNCD